MDLAVQELHEKRTTLISRAKTMEEFKTIFKYLAFVACAGKAPIRQKMLDETLARVAKAGDVENIERWCLWTPTQLSLLEQAENLTRVILIGGNGTGKTAMLDAFATNTAKKQPEEMVNFAIHQCYPQACPLLQLILESKYEEIDDKDAMEDSKLS